MFRLKPNTVIIILLFLVISLLLLKGTKQFDSASKFSPNKLLQTVKSRFGNDHKPVVIKSYDFDGEADFKGWRAADSAINKRQTWTEEGLLNIRRSGVMTEISNSIGLDSSDFNLVEIRIKAQPRDALRLELKWTSGTNDQGGAFVIPAATTETEWHTILAPVGQSSAWTGVIKELKIIFSNAPDILQIDWIRLVRDDNQALLMRENKLRYIIGEQLEWIAPESLQGKFQREYQVPEEAKLIIHYGLDKSAWLDHPSELMLRISVKVEKEPEKDIAQIPVLPRKLGGKWKWFRKEIDLGEFSNQKVTLTFENISLKSKAKRTILWGEPVIVSSVDRQNDNRPNFVILLVDALRPDHLGAYGYDRPTSPNIDALALDGIVFENAFAQSNCTTLSTASLLTSRFPLDAKEAHSSYFSIKPGISTIFKELDNIGYQTAVFTQNALVHWDYHYDEGVDSFLVGSKSKPMGNDVSGWISDYRDAPFLIYVHYMDVHADYQPPTELLSKFVPRDYQPIEPAVQLGKARDMEDSMSKGHSYGEKDKEYTIGLYDGTIAYTDQQIGQLIARLKTLGLYNNTVILVIADHGEEFWEHGGLRHSSTLYDEQLRVPLILKPPLHLDRKAERISSLARLIDLYPTIMQLTGLTIPPDIEGIYLLDAELEKNLSVYAETPEMVAIRTREWKLIDKIGNNKDELYNLKLDPREKINVIAKHPDISARLQGEIKHFKKNRTSSKSIEQRPKKLDQKTIDRLRALGYLK